MYIHTCIYKYIYIHIYSFLISHEVLRYIYRKPTLDHRGNFVPTERFGTLGPGVKPHLQPPARH